MSGIAKVGDKMKKKISFGDYALNPIVEKQEEITKARKIYTLSHEDDRKLQEIFSQRVNTPNATSIAQIMSEAITLFHKLETSFESFRHPIG